MGGRQAPYSHILNILLVVRQLELVQGHPHFVVLLAALPLFLLLLNLNLDLIVVLRIVLHEVIGFSSYVFLLKVSDSLLHIFPGDLRCNASFFILTRVRSVRLPTQRTHLRLGLNVPRTKA